MSPTASASTDEQVNVPIDVLQMITAHARRESPNECCGLLIGEHGRVMEAVAARNALASPTRFLIDPEDHFAALRRARLLGGAIIGAYHSHPVTPAVPSPRDLDESADPTLIHLIVSLEGADGADAAIAAYRFGEGNFQQLALVPAR
jgi:proteasome lid subunit RPN8/RPN11